MTELTIIRRDTIELQTTFTDSDGNVVDITGGTVFFTVKKNIYDADSSAVISKDVTSFDAPTTGVALINLSPSDTNVTPRTYYYDIQLLLDGNVSSSIRGKFNVIQDVTYRTS